MRKTKLDAEKTRQQLLDAALEMFYQHGVTNTSLQAIAEQAGVTRGALYWHFKNKEDLFDALFEQHFEPFLQQIDRVMTLEGNAWENLCQTLREVFLAIESKPTQKKFCHIMHAKCEQTEKNASITQLAQQYHQRSHEQMLRVLAYCRQQGSIPEQTDLELVAIYLKSTFTGIINTWVFAPQAMPLSSRGLVLLNVHLDNLKTHPVFQAA